MEVASVWGFRSNPRAFYEWIASLAERMSSAEPNAAHHALAELERMGTLRALITQNIDNLHQRAGSQRVLELHGHTRTARCTQCGKEVPLREVYEQWVLSHEVPRCPRCGKGVLKPAVVLFGERLPAEVLHEAQTEARACDLMLVAGSSLEVSPASELPMLAYRAGAKVVIVNYEPTPMDAHATVLIRGDVAEVLPLIAAGVRDGG